MPTLDERAVPNEAGSQDKQIVPRIPTLPAQLTEGAWQR